MGRFDNVDLGTDKTMNRMIAKQQEYDKEIWNAAIEAAAKECDRIFLTDNMRIVVSDEIRRLKK